MTLAPKQPTATPAAQHSPRWTAVWRATYHSFLCALAPTMLFLSILAGVIPLSLMDVGRSLAALLITNLLLLGAISQWRPAEAAAAVLSWFYIAQYFYIPVLKLQRLIVPGVSEAVAALIFVAGSILAAVRLGRPQRDAAQQRALIMTVVSGTLLVASGTLTGWHASGFSTSEARDDIASLVVAAPVPVKVPQQPPDIYYVVLDGFGRPDVLRDRYGLDATPTMLALRELGWTLPARSRTNYTQTYLSLASTLNGNYLDPLASTMGDSLNRWPLRELIERSGTIAALKRAGYTFTMVGSNTSVTSHHRQADECACAWPGLNEFENAVLATTPFRKLPLYQLTFGGQYAAVIGGFDALEREPASSAPQFVFSHIMAPHPPFVVAADGSRVVRHGAVNFQDGDQYVGSKREYLSGYRQQAEYVLDRLVRFARLMNSRKRPTLIVVHGDHGPGSAYSHESLSKTDPGERFPIFMGLRLGPGDRRVSDDLSPVNTFRVLFNAHFGGTYELLPNRSFYAPWKAPYRLTEVSVP
jgi:hypothetical protein